MFREMLYTIDRSHRSPDFACINPAARYYVEAVTLNATLAAICRSVVTFWVLMVIRPPPVIASRELMTRLRQPPYHEKAIDGMLNYIGGSDGIYMNYRFAQPTRTQRQHIARWFPEFQFPSVPLDMAVRRRAVRRVPLSLRRARGAIAVAGRMMWRTTSYALASQQQLISPQERLVGNGKKECSKMNGPGSAARECVLHPIKPAAAP